MFAVLLMGVLTVTSAANLPTVTFRNFFLSLKIARKLIIPGSAGPIFTIFSPIGRYFIVDDRSGLLFF